MAKTARLIKDVIQGQVIASESVGAEGFCLLATEDMKAGDEFQWDNVGRAYKVVTDG